MKRILALCIILAAVLIVSGCICLSGGTHAPQAGQAVATPSAVPAEDASSSIIPDQASPSQASAQNIHPFDPGQAAWVEYKMTDSDGGGATDVRLDYSDRTVNGMSMKTVKRTVSYNSGSGSGDGYSYDPGSNTLNVKMSGSSSSSSTGTESSPDQMKATDPVLAAGDLVFTPEGQETVTVPKGTYECDKYAASFNGADCTYWASGGVPVPIKIAYENKIMELEGWG